MVSEGVVWTLEKDLCRCCHAEGKFENLATPQSFMDQQEIYLHMLRECFDIDISPVPGPLCNVTYTICSICVVKLRYANTFKQQVLKCEEKFSELLFKNSILVPGYVKSEPEGDLDDFKDSSPDDSDDDNNKPLYEYKLEVEVDSDEDKDEDKSEDEDEGESMHQINLRKRPAKDVKKHTSDDAGSVKLKKTTKPKAKPKAPAKTTAKETQETAPSEKKKEGTTLIRRFYYPPEDYTVKDDIFTCTRCKKEYKNLDTLKMHIRRDHFKIPKHKCPSCDQGFMTKSQYILHKLEKHNIDDRFQCSACQTKFNTPDRLRKHFRIFHMLGKKYKCPSCDFETFSGAALYKHKFKHKTVKDYHCRFCKKAFMRKATLSLHEKIHTGDKQKVCQVKDCGQAFVQKASLNYHMMKYHPNVQY